MNIELSGPQHRGVGAIETLRREHRARKVKQYVLSRVVKGQDFVDARPGKFGLTLSSNSPFPAESERNDHIVEKVRSDLADQGIDVEPVSIIDPDSTDGMLYGFRRVEQSEE